MTTWSFIMVLTGALTFSSQLLRLVDWLDRPVSSDRRCRRAH